MSMLSDAEKALMTATAQGVQAMLASLTIDPNSKAAIANPIGEALDALKNEAMAGAVAIVADVGGEVLSLATHADAAIVTPALKESVAGEPPLDAVESVVGQVVEGTVDAAIRTVTGPLAPAAIEVANGLLEMLGRDAEQAIAALFHAKQVTTTPTVKSVAQALVAGDTPVPTENPQ